MPKKTRYILIVIFIIAGLGILLLSQLARRERQAVGDLYGAAVGNLGQTSSADLTLVLDTFVQPPAGFGADGGLLDSIDLPIRVIGPLRVAYPADGAVSASMDMDISSTLGNVALLTLRGQLTPQGEIFAQLDDLPDDMGADLDVAQLNGAWFTVDDRAVGQLVPWSDINSTDANASTVLSANQLRSALSGIFIPYRRYEDMPLNGRTAAHYEMAVDESRLVEFLSLATSTARGTLLTSEERQSISDHIAARRWLAEAWVDINTEQFLEIKLGIFPFDDESGMPVALSLRFGEFNQVFDLTAPETAKPLSAVLIKALRTPAGN